MSAQRQAHKFFLDARIEADTINVAKLALCQIRLMNDCRFPWLVLVPQRRDATEIFDLKQEDQSICYQEISLISRMLKQATGCDKINIAAFGNMVPQLHIHIVARNQTDPAWPDSAIGFGTREAYTPDAAAAMVTKLRQVISTSH